VQHSVKDNLIAAIRHVLRPLCRIAIRNGVQFGDLSQALQDALAAAASSELKNAGHERPSDDEIGRVTGMSMEQIQASSERPGFTGSGVVAYSWASVKVLAGWNSDSDYLGPYGLVLDIPFREDEKKSDGRSFERLVLKYAGPGVSAQGVLNELIKSQNVMGIGEGFYRCVTRTYIAERLSPENIQIFAETMHNVIGTLAVNLKRTVPGTGLLERKVFADFGLREEDLAKFNAFIRVRGQVFADEVDNWLSDYSNTERQGPIKTGIGLYHYIESDEDRDAYAKSLGKGTENEK
jgi:hypothetical protein